jgi:hypothetical protein
MRKVGARENNKNVSLFIHCVQTFIIIIIIVLLIIIKNVQLIFLLACVHETEVSSSLLTRVVKFWLGTFFRIITNCTYEMPNHELYIPNA